MVKARAIIKPNMFAIKEHKLIFEGISKMIEAGVYADSTNFILYYPEL